MDYIIIQAGGKGTRLGYLTTNKPKALAPIENLPMIFHLFRKYPDKRFIVIADYKKEVLRRYLSSFADVRYQVVDAAGSGTCSGIGQAVNLIPEGKAFMLIWSDLILPDGFELPSEYETVGERKSEKDTEAYPLNGKNVAAEYSAARDWKEPENKEHAGKEKEWGQEYSGIASGNESAQDKNPNRNYIGISTTFPCRWKYENGVFKEESSTEHGVAGFFLFHDKAVLDGIPESGELVRWMQEKELHFEEVSLAGTREFGLLEEYKKLAEIKTRPFNRITIDGDILTKEPVDEQGKNLARRESAWYEKAAAYHIRGIPRIYDTAPLKMEVIRGKNIYETGQSKEEKRNILKKLVCTLKDLHKAETVPADSFSLKEAYFNKTMDRLGKVEDLVPFAREKFIRINGRTCRNVFFYKDRLERALDQLKCSYFSFIHGDCTFSNLMLRENGDPVLIDPRGYFGFTELYGDDRYDWAKLYYSIVGNYDRFNLKQFSLEIGEKREKTEPSLDEGEVMLKIQSNGWEDMEDEFFQLTGADRFEIKLLHAVIWLSLTTYAWQDYDSVCGAFYNGLYYLEEVL